MEARLTALMTGCASCVPGLRMLTARRTGGTISARYCYAVWLRHLRRLAEAGLPTRFRTMLELGPGDSLGVGFAAQLSAADRYVALDIVRYVDPDRNLRIFGELLSLFQDRSPIPGHDVFPQVHPPLMDYVFPHDLLSRERLAEMLDPARLRRLEALIRDPPAQAPSAAICYAAPWRTDVVAPGSVDLMLSQSVLQYSPDLRASYAEMERWIRPGGVMSHEIDFKSIGRTHTWNGHWACSDLTWAIMQGRRRNPLNRAPLSAHLRIQEDLGFDILTCLRNVRSDGIARARLSRSFSGLDDTDLTTASVLLQSRKRADAADGDGRLSGSRRRDG